MTLYHYSTISNGTVANGTSYDSGVIEVDRRVSSVGDYQAILTQLADSIGKPKGTFVVTSFNEL